MIWKRREHAQSAADSQGEGKLSISEESGVTVVQVDFQLLFDDPVNDKVQGELVELVKNMESPHVVLDMGRVEAIGSRFLGTMVAVRRRVKRRHGRMVFARVKPEMVESFRVTQLTDMFHFYESVEKAVASFQS